MKKFSIVICLILAMASVYPVSAKPHEPTGELIYITDGAQEFPANTAFYTGGGWILSMDYPYPIGTWGFSLTMDGVDLEPTYTIRNVIPCEDDSGSLCYQILSDFVFPDGLTGTHHFVGRWYGPCQAALDYGLVEECEKPYAPYDVIVNHAHITFVEP